MTSEGSALLLRTILTLALFALTALEVWVVKTSTLDAIQSTLMTTLIGSTSTLSVLATTYFFGTSKGSTDAVRAIVANQMPNPPPDSTTTVTTEVKQ